MICEQQSMSSIQKCNIHAHTFQKSHTYKHVVVHAHPYSKTQMAKKTTGSKATIQRK